jgi:hypothetical protein
MARSALALFDSLWWWIIRNINAMYYPLCQLYLRPVARVSNGYFSGISEVVVIKIDAI